MTSPQTVDNPWSRAPSVQSPTPATVSFSDIVQDEIQKHESLAQVTSKPLALIQVTTKVTSKPLALIQVTDVTKELRFWCHYQGKELCMERYCIRDTKDKLSC